MTNPMHKGGVGGKSKEVRSVKKDCLFAIS